MIAPHDKIESMTIVDGKIHETCRKKGSYVFDIVIDGELHTIRAAKGSPIGQAYRLLARLCMLGDRIGGFNE